MVIYRIIENVWVSRVFSGGRSIIMNATNKNKGFTLVEVIIALSLLALLALFVAGVALPIRTATQQAKNETLASNMAFAVLEAIRVQARGLDLDRSVTLNELGLTNPNNLRVTIICKKDVQLPDIYLVCVEVAGGGNLQKSVTMCSMVRK